MSKRRRVGPNVVRAARRPIDKSLINIVLSSVVGSQQTVELQPTAPFPSTLTGLRWSLTCLNDAGTAETNLHWAIVFVPQGTTASTLSKSNEATLYSPEQNVLSFGVCSSLTSVGSQAISFEGSTKTMRKFKVGDTLDFICLGVATNAWDVRGVVQFFMKT